MPSEFELAVGASVRGVVVLSNMSETRLRYIRVRYAGAGRSIHFRINTGKQTIPPGESVVLGFRVARLHEGSGKNVQIRLVVTYYERPSKARAKHAIVSTVTVKPTTGPTLAEARIESNFENINENRSGEGALVITNPREAPLQLEEVLVRAPDDVDITMICRENEDDIRASEGATRKVGRAGIRQCRGNAQVQPRSQELWPMRFVTPDALSPGKRVVLLRLRVSDPRGLWRVGRTSTFAAQTVVASKALSVDVFAESEILKALGVPAFFLLPGVIVIAGVWFLLSYAYPRRRGGNGKAPLFPDINKATEKVSLVVLFGVGISLVIAQLYPWFTEAIAPKYERDYLKAYGFRDFYYVFAYSLGISVAVWIVLAVLHLARRLWRWLFVLSDGDEPGDVLRKLGLTSWLGNLLRKVMWDTPLGRTRVARVALPGRQETRALRLKRRKDQLLVSPTISVELTDGSSRDLARKIEDYIETNRGFLLWVKVRTAVWLKRAQISYQSNGSIDNPKLVKRSDARPTGQEGPIVALPTG